MEGEEVYDQNQMIRPPITDVMLAVAQVMSFRGTCLKRQIGCVLASADGFILSTGYNGAPRGMKHCREVGCLIEDDRCVRSLHAEVNAVITAARMGVELRGVNAYVTVRPCLRCALVLIQAGCASVIWSDDREDSSDYVEVYNAFHEAPIYAHKKEALWIPTLTIQDSSLDFDQKGNLFHREMEEQKNLSDNK